MASMYDPFAAFYDLEYGGRKDDLVFYRRLAKTFGGPILEVGVGTGRVALDLARRGFHVCGIDNSLPMLNYAKNKLQQQPKTLQKKVELVHADMRKFNLARQFRLCIVPFRTFLHNLTQKQQLSCLRSIHTHLQNNGILAMDLFVPLYQMLQHSQWRVHIPSEQLQTKDSSLSITSEIRHNPSKQMLNIKNIYQQENHEPLVARMSYRYVFRYEMELLLQMAGYRVLSCAGGFENEDYNFHSGIMCFVAQKT